MSLCGLVLAIACRLTGGSGSFGLSVTKELAIV